ncbi:unnamed protein product [Clonostachys rhizophaga]|uniref:E3 ubiquitin-protein ligase CHFR n=1 Tax=Clonostachys rhizophaga TaxID=160324 RepID=A0A9N9V458_9HYPO|nr:unnamed protein product [Clonostachys rhizophaga]
MESPKSGLELERELTCSICTELLYQPLTLLDCLHTFCGSCLKEWFSFQAAKIENAPNPPPSDAAPFTCPSCRAPVRDTRHSATFVTLLDMLISAHPEKARTDADKEDMASKYKPGDQVIPKIKRRERTAEERRADEEDRRLVDSVREISLRETGGAPPQSSRPQHRRDSRSRSSGDTASDTRQRRTREGGHRHRRDEPRRQNSDQLAPDGEPRRRRRSESRQRQADQERAARPQIGHQSSLRSLISSADMNDRDIEKEIEEFARQIQEEGLLNGLDLDNIDLSRDDELSRRITEAYRRRQRGRTRNETSSRSNGRSSNSNSGHSSSTRPTESSQGDRGPTSASNGGRQGSSRPNRQTRSASASGHSEDRRRPPTAWTANLDARDSSSTGRRRASSNGRSTTVPTVPAFSTPPTSDSSRPAARSQTDLTLPPGSVDAAGRARPATSSGRSSSSPVTNTSPTNLPASSAPNLQSFANRATQANSNPTPGRSTTPPETSQQPTQTNRQRANPPAELPVMHSSASGPISTSPILSPVSAGHQRKRSQLYPEPSITCARCGKTHIEYEVHYNCHICANGQWNICLTCYRASLGCKHWFGFGYAAWVKWEKIRNRSDSPQAMSPPHVLTAHRYIPPQHQPGGADGRKTLTAYDPKNRLEIGMFCARCSAWANECFWRCEQCNENDWGFCNNCVNQGKSCSHMLLPLTNEVSSSQDRPKSPRSPGPPATASILTGPSGSSVGDFKPLTFATRCDICQDPIGLTQTRYHCYSCKSALIADATPGDYDICTSCYDNLVQHGEISPENGHSGWRRCLNGHRMVVIGFTEGKIGLWRYVDHDLVGGRALGSEPYTSVDKRGLELVKWSWPWGDQKRERLVSKNVKHAAPSSDGGVTFTQTFPPDGGVGARATAKWAWYPASGNDDELMFPRGAEIKEVEDMNGDWFFGTYMGAKGVFPAPYVRLHQEN